MFENSPIVASPTYDRCGTFDPSPIDALFVSTNVPIFPLTPNRVPGRKYANGPTDAPSPTSADTATVLSTRAPAPTRVSVNRACGPTSQPSARCVPPSNCVPGCTTTSRSNDTVASTHVDAGSTTVTPDNIAAVSNRSFRIQIGRAS